MKKNFLLMLMAMLLPLATWAADATKTFTVTIAGADKDGNITYAGDATTPSISVTVDGKDATPGSYSIAYYAVGADQKETAIKSTGVRNVGDYKIVVAAVGDEYFGYTPKNVTFKVLPKTVTNELTLTKGVTKDYGQLDSVMLQKLVTTIPSGVLESNTDAAAERADFLNCLRVARYEDKEDANPEGIGEHKVIVLGEDNPVNSNYKYVAPKDGGYVTITINKATLKVTLEGKDYNGVAVTVANLTAKKIDGIVNSEDVTVKFSYKGEVKNAGTYNLATTLEGNDTANYTVAKTVDYVIKPLNLTIKLTTGKNLTDEYAGKTGLIDLTDRFTFEGLLKDPEETVQTINAAVKADVKTGDVASNYTVGLYEDGKLVTKLTNYTAKFDKEYKYAITKREFGNGKDFAINIDPTKATYQGKNFVIPEGLITITYTHDDKVDTLKSTDYELAIIEASDSLMSANSTFRVQATATGTAGNFTGVMNSNPVTIIKKMLTITAKDNQTWERPYNGVNYQDTLTTQFNYDAFVPGEDADSIGLSMKRQYSDPRANTYNVLVYNGKSLWNAENNAFKNYDITYADTAKFVIKPVVLTYHIADTTVMYNGAAQNIDFEIVADFQGNDSWEKVERTDAKAIVKPIVKVDGNAKDAGEYKLYVENWEEVKAGNSYTIQYDSLSNGKLTILPGKMTITAPNKDIAFGTEVNDSVLAKWAEWDNGNGTILLDSTAAGVNKLDADRTLIRQLVKLSLSEAAATGATGEYKGGIVVALDTVGISSEQQIALDNYGGLDAIKYVYGTLNIGGLNELVLDGGVKGDTLLVELNSHNGATYERVIFKNLKPVRGGIEKEKWYTLVLPFDITVRELSSKFGYAIVNVPDTNNDKSNLMKFKLTMGTVDANTLMLFKVDAPMDWEELGDTIVFEDKTIVAPTDDWATDVAGNQYIGVYQEYKTGDREFFIWTDGKPWGGTAETSVTVYPLSGYVRYNKAPDNPQLSLENPDGTTTIISAVNVDSLNAAEGWYTVGGVKLEGEPTQKGVYINNGKKVVIK